MKMNYWQPCSKCPCNAVILNLKLVKHKAKFHLYLPLHHEPFAASNAKVGVQWQIKDNLPLIVFSPLCQFRQPFKEGGFKCEFDSKWLLLSLGGCIIWQMNEGYFLVFRHKGCPTSHELIATTAPWQGKNEIWEIGDWEYDSHEFKLGEIWIWITWLERRSPKSELVWGFKKYIYMNTCNW